MQKILLIEDNLAFRENTAEILELAGYEVITAQDGRKGVELARSGKPDLIICDIMMPVLDGYGVLLMLQRDQKLQDVPFIFLSARSERADIRKGMEMGADDYISKPYDGTELLGAIETRLKKAEALKRTFTQNLNGVNDLITAVANRDYLSELKENRSVNVYRKKQVIYSQGNYPSKLYYILKGKVKSFRCNEDGKELILKLYKEGDFIGHMALLEDVRYQETAQALEDCELAVIPKAEFDELVGSNPMVLKSFINILARNIRENEEHLLGIAFQSVRKKVAFVLLSLYHKYHTVPEKPFTIDISRENLASIAGIAKESMIRTLSDFKEENLINIEASYIQVLNYQRLQQLVG